MAQNVPSQQITWSATCIQTSTTTVVNTQTKNTKIQIISFEEIVALEKKWFNDMAKRSALNPHSGRKVIYNNESFATICKITHIAPSKCGCVVCTPTSSKEFRNKSKNGRVTKKTK
jgi:hypothetical protein